MIHTNRSEKNKLVTCRADYLIYLCAFISCFVPRYIATLKIHIGINISMYDIAVIGTWLLTTRRLKIVYKIENAYFMIWAVFILGSIWRAQKLGIWLYYVLWLLGAILFQQILLHHYKKDTSELVIKALTDALFIQLLIGLSEITFRHYMFEVGVSRTQWGTVPISLFYNLNDYATFIVTLLPFAIYFLINRRGVMSKIYYGFIAALDIYFIFVSGSRAAFLSFLVFFACLFFIWGEKRNVGRLFIPVLFVAAIVAVVASTAAREAIIEKLRNGLVDPTGRSDNARINLIKNGLYFLSETYGFGVGAGNLYEWLNHRSIYNIGKLSFIHNWYLELMVTFGVYFFIVYCVFHMKLLLSIYKRSKAERRIYTVNTAVMTSFVLFSVMSISSSSNIYSEWIWMYLAFTATFSLMIGRDNSARSVMRLDGAAIMGSLEGR